MPPFPGAAQAPAPTISRPGRLAAEPVRPARDPGADHSLRGRCVVFLHAHPDDEAIFTAATMHRLARRGARVVLVTATGGDLGPALRPLRSGQALADVRRTELEQACALLGVARLVLLGRRDSGMPGWPDNGHPDALARADVPALARNLARLCAAEGAEALVHYDPGGIYPHPDHLAVHRIGVAAAGHAGIAGYQATVDRDRIGGRHLVGRAAAGLPRPAGEQSGPPAAPRLGRHRDEVTTVVAADAADLAAKRAAMAAHASQIDRAALRRRGFAETYGLEWYVGPGIPGLLDSLSPAVPA
ncbi:MAG TPA: PIG-L family deacetylase [Mycobacteriales bacterium]|nr:PIG-L family deacetylase [Mycobacteriales bacterium]